MALKMFLSVVVVSYHFGQSLQDECKLTTWGLRNQDQDQKGQLHLLFNCTEGDITVHYPQGSLNVTFPWSLLPNGTRWARVCLTRDVESSVFSATDITGKDHHVIDFSRSISYPQAGDDLDRDAWVCTKSHRIPTTRNCGSRRLRCRTRSNRPGPKGIRLTLYFGESVELYLQVISYKMEEGELPQRRGGKRG